MVPIPTISLVTLFVGTTIAAIWDLKTTEVPDQVSYVMIAIALLLSGYISFAEWSYKPILNSLIFGLSFLGLGFLMYYLGQWGGADALILSAVGFLLPTSGIITMFPLAATFLVNLFVVGAIYMLIYAIVFAFLHKRVIFQFGKELKASSKILIFGSIGLFIIFFIANYYVFSKFLPVANYSVLILNSLLPLALTIGLFLVWKFARTVEEYGFKKKISVSKLRIGDMLMEEKKLVGITSEQLRRIRRTGKRSVWIKEGIRFAASFPLALAFTLLWGDSILLFLKILV